MVQFSYGRGGAYKQGKNTCVSMQELEGQRGEGAYFETTSTVHLGSAMTIDVDHPSYIFLWEDCLIGCNKD